MKNSREQLLEAALVEYVEKYGLTEAARLALLKQTSGSYQPFIVSEEAPNATQG